VAQLPSGAQCINIVYGKNKPLLDFKY